MTNSSAQFGTALPQLSGDLFLTDGGIETTLMFLQGFDLPHFAAFDLLRDRKGLDAIRGYYRSYLDIAVEGKTGFILETPTWRASSDWGTLMGYSKEALAAVNEEAIQMMIGLRQEYEDRLGSIVIAGNLGPRGDGYEPDKLLSAEEAEIYHTPQIAAFERSGTDFVSVLTMTHAAEAIGIVRASKNLQMPVAVSFTVETDGALPTGQSLEAAIKEVDAETGAYPAYYMVNCAHPTHFSDKLTGAADWLARIHGVRANASTCSHAELDEATELDAGNPEELAAQYQELRSLLPNLNVLGGCCGTDQRHITQILQACKSSTG